MGSDHRPAHPILKVSNADRLVFPGTGVTKGQVVDYYRSVTADMFPYLVGRALTVERYPKGVGAKGFMQKNAPGHFGKGLITVHEVPKEDGITRYPVVTDPAAVAAFANFGVISFHVPGSTIHDPKVLDTLVWDLDPTEGDVDKVRRAAAVLRSHLRRYGLEPVLMTSGSKGYHLRVPVPGGIEHQDAVTVTRGLSALAAVESPELFTMAFRKDERGDRVFLDWMRNAPYSTSVAPFSLRARAGAPVAAPITWDLLEIVAPDEVSIDNWEEFGMADAWAGSAPAGPGNLASRVGSHLEDKGITLEPFDRFRS